MLIPTDELVSLREHPALTAGVVVTSCLLLMRGSHCYTYSTLAFLQSALHYQLFLVFITIV